MQELLTAIGNIGLPAVILVYLIWRFDRFLTYLCGKLDKYNDELGDIGTALKELVQYTKGRKDLDLK